MLALAIGFAAALATTSIAKRSHVRHHSASAEPNSGRRSGEIWSDSNYGFARVPFWDSQHPYPKAFRGECTLDDGPFPCDPW